VHIEHQPHKEDVDAMFEATRFLVNRKAAEVHVVVRARGSRASGCYRLEASFASSSGDQRSSDARSRNRKPAAVLLVPHDDDLESLMLRRSPRFQAMLDRSRQSIKQGKALSEKEFWEAVRSRAASSTSAKTRARRAKR
jgi:hypothetical protein